MTSNTDQVQDVKATDSTAVANPLITEVNQTLANNTGKDTSMVDYLKVGTAKANEIFGALQLTDGEVKGPALFSENAKSADGAKATSDAAAPTGETAKPAGDNVAQGSDAAQHLADLLKQAQESHAFQPEGKADAKVAASVKPEASEPIKVTDTKALDSLKKDPEIQTKHDALVKHAKETMKEPELSKFTHNLEKFEAREANAQRQVQKEFENKGMSPEKAAAEAEKRVHKQVSDTFDNVDKLMAHSAKSPVSDKDRVTLAQEVMRHAASPETVSQGSYGTCSVASVESRTYDKDPAQASRVVTEVALSGSYFVPGHASIKLDANSLQKQGDANHKNADGKENNRDFASQLFEVTAVNIYLQRQNESTNPPGQVRFEQHAPVRGQTPDDSGERVMDYSQHPPKVIAKDIGLTTPELVYVAKQISPQSTEGVVAIAGGSRDDVSGQILEAECQVHGLNGGKMFDTKDANWAKKAHDAVAHSSMNAADKAEVDKAISEYELVKSLDDSGSVVHVHNTQELKAALLKLTNGKDGSLPAIIGVNAGNEPFWSDSYGAVAGGAGGEHVVNVVGYNPETGMVTIRNQWDKFADHDVPVKDLYEATKKPVDAIPDLKQDIAAAKAAGHRDYVKEYELLRLEKENKLITDADFEKQTVEVTVAKAKDLKEHKITDDEWATANSEFVTMYHQMEKSSKGSERALANQIQKDMIAGLKALNHS